MRKSDLVEVFIRIIGILLFIQLIDQFDQLSWYNWKLILKIIVSMVLVLKAKWISYKLHQKDRHNMIIQGTLSPYTIYELAFLICGYLLLAIYIPSLFTFVLEDENSTGKTVTKEGWYIGIGTVQILFSKRFASYLAR